MNVSRVHPIIHVYIVRVPPLFVTNMQLQNEFSFAHIIIFCWNFRTGKGNDCKPCVKEGATVMTFLNWVKIITV